MASVSTDIDSSERRRGRQSTASILLQFLGSMNLAITLLVVIAIASIIGTVVHQNQPYQDYLIKFGPFWFEIFESFGIYDVYSASWYLFLLAFLVVSVSVCVYRHSPVVIKEMTRFREHQQERSLRSLRHHTEWQVAASPADAEQTAARVLARNGFRMRRKAQDDAVVLAGMRGRSNRIGYIFTHLAIVVICVGGLIDGNLMLKLREVTGQLQIETRNDIPVSQIGSESRLPVGRGAFRGNVTIPEGGAASVAFLNLREGYVVQDLPFRLQVEEFRIEHYDTGEPRSFESDVILTAPDLDEPIRQTIRVNHPLVYNGYAIYQASFGDGGSRLDLRAWPLAGDDREPIEFDERVERRRPIEINGTTWTLELAEFEPLNVRPNEGAETRRDVRNVGPRFTYRLRSETGEAREFDNYMMPVEVAGRWYFLSGVRGSPQEDFRYLHIPADSSHRPDTFLAFHAILSGEQRLRAASERAAGLVMEDFGLADSSLTPQIAATARDLVRRLLEEDFPSVMAHMERTLDDRNIPEERRELLVRFSRMALEQTLWEAYQEAAGLDADLEQDAFDESHQAFFRDAIAAIESLDQYGAPLFLELRDFEHRQATGLMIARAPGKNIVYFGSALLVLGVILMFYVSHRRAWCVVRPDGKGGSRLLFAAVSHRDPIGFAKLYDSVTAELAARLGSRDDRSTDRLPPKT
ncbi:cytochrome c biogenesis protein [Natronocella acetinitrilica]|uniref:Cytochrome c biogenesis protein n=1 Tax=Natronocella acetinitrilica TaxID=414046 RepID=A0AAE3G0X8_9GAMM|nr:cytochrome c biogenesis protein ResB [Natronocella acetinitrilica]MCP1673449.1 cytochrome c biogenesis protein [Natronocella acetinitrilica]